MRKIIIARIVSLLIMTLLTFHNSFCQTFKIEEFVHVNPPKVGSLAWHSLNQSNYEFSVSKEKGKLVITKPEYGTKTHITEFELLSGKLIGTDGGEWGGELYFMPEDSTKGKVHIKEGNIKFIFKFNDSIYFIEGLAHLSYNEGALYRLDFQKDTFMYSKIIDFEDAPEAFTIYKNKILIASHQNFFMIHDFRKEIIFKDTFWTSLYPNSIAALNDKQVYVGIRSGFIHLDLTKRIMRFYKYRKVEI